MEWYVKKLKRKLRKQTPPDADRHLITEFYKQAKFLTKTTGIQYHVDHIIPLSKGGKHHQDNLQVITAKENLRKHAKIPSNTCYLKESVI